MKTVSVAAVFATALFASSTTAQVCQPSDGESIKTWMWACDSVTGSFQSKCDDAGCHAALHLREAGRVLPRRGTGPGSHPDSPYCCANDGPDTVAAGRDPHDSGAKCVRADGDPEAAMLSTSGSRFRCSKYCT
ncbi:hypothetical protein PybrP1_009900 [[Pythium] brassicae (nom. inval.)]|nr:hypothetical protein PybrP1_009900 [[Pythium] brassicae (nom. inval.)]